MRAAGAPSPAGRLARKSPGDLSRFAPAASRRRGRGVQSSARSAPARARLVCQTTLRQDDAMSLDKYALALAQVNPAPRRSRREPRDHPRANRRGARSAGADLVVFPGVQPHRLLPQGSGPGDGAARRLQGAEVAARAQPPNLDRGRDRRGIRRFAVLQLRDVLRRRRSSATSIASATCRPTGSSTSSATSRGAARCAPSIRASAASRC